MLNIYELVMNLVVLVSLLVVKLESFFYTHRIHKLKWNADKDRDVECSWGIKT